MKNIHILKLLLIGFILTNLSAINLDYNILQDDKLQKADDGWSLLGASHDINVEEITNTNSDIKIVYLYKNNQWFAYSSDTVLSKKIATSANLSKLTKINAGDGFWIFVSKFINQTPTATITINKDYIKRYETIQFLSNAYDTDSDDLSYYWDFGDGTFSREKNPTHSYDKSNNYNVKLTVTDTHGDFVTTNKNIIINNGIAQKKLEKSNFPNTYSYSINDTSITQTAKYKDNKSLNMNHTESSYIYELGKHYTISQDYVLQWNNKGYDGTMILNDYLAMNETYEGINAKVYFTKMKRYIFVDCLDKNIKVKVNSVGYMRFSNGIESEVLYFKVDNYGMNFLENKNEYNRALNNFDSNYNNLVPIVDSSIPKSVLDEIFTDLGY